MDSMTGKIRTVLERYKYAALILLVGIGLMLWPQSAQTTEPEEEPEPLCKDSVQQELEEILSHIDGVGKVRVLLTMREGERLEYQTDESGSGSDTVVITNADRQQQGLVVQALPPVYLGAVVVCQGGAIPAVRLSVVEAVSNVTGLGADRITVLKMK